MRRRRWSKLRRPSKKKHAYKYQPAGHEKAGRTNLHDAVDGFQKRNTGRDRLHKEAEVADENQQKTVVEQQGKHPEPLGGKIDGARPVADGVIFAHIGNRVAEQRTEEKYFQKHAPHDVPSVAGAVEPIGLDEVKRNFLAAVRGDGVGYRTLCNICRIASA